MTSGLVCVIKRDLALAMRQRSDVLTTLFFFVIVVSLFPFAVGPDADLLREMGGGVVWVAALLATMLSLARLFANDYADGTLEQLILTPRSLSVLVLGKVISHWLTTGLPLVLISPLIGLQYDIGSEALVVLVLTLLLGTPVLSLIGGIGAALTLGLRGGGVLVSLLILPLYVPVLIFGAGAVEAVATVMSTATQLSLTDVLPEVKAHIALLSAMLVLALVFAPVAIAAAVRISTE